MKNRNCPAPMSINAKLMSGAQIRAKMDISYKQISTGEVIDLDAFERHMAQLMRAKSINEKEVERRSCLVLHELI